MFKYPYTLNEAINARYFNNYMLQRKDQFYYDGSIVDGQNVEVCTSQQLTESEVLALNAYVLAYSNAANAIERKIFAPELESLNYSALIAYEPQLYEWKLYEKANGGKF